MRPLTSLLIVGILLTSLIRLALGQPTDVGLVAHWQFDESAGTTAHDVTGHYDGQLTATGASFDTNGIAGNALKLNATQNGFVLVTNLVPLVSNDFSVVAWAKLPPGDTTFGFLCSKHEAWYSDGFYVLLNQYGGQGAASKATVLMNDLGHMVTSTSSINDGQWHQIVAVYGKGGQTALYVDGSPAEAATASPSIVDRSAPFIIGGLYGNVTIHVPKGYFTGWIDDVQVYSRVLTDSQIGALFHNPGKNLVDLQASPIISPAGGAFVSSVDVTLTATVAGTTIRYTLDGSDPVATSPAYSTRITLTGTTTVKARLFVNGYPVSDVASAAFTALPVGVGLVAHWKFDESSGTTAHDATGHYDGQLTATGASFDTNGIAGNALKLDRAQNGFVIVTNLVRLVTNDFSVGVWVKLAPGDTTSSTFAISQHEDWYDNGFCLWLNQEGTLGAPGKATFWVNDGNHIVTSTTAVNDGQWHQIMAVYAKVGQSTIYVDGSPVEASIVSRAIVDRSAPFLIGGRYGFVTTGVPNGYFTGWIDEVQVYSQVLTDGEIDALFHNPGKNLVDLQAPLIISPAGGTFVGSVDVTLTATVAGTTIRYTLDGSDPAATSPAYSTLITLTGTTTVKARLFVNDYPVSDVVSATFTALPATPCAPVPTGLVGWWPFEKNANDITDGHNGTVIGTGTFTHGTVGQALAFNGTDTAVRVAAAPDLNVGQGDGMTMELWIKPAQVAVQAPLVEWNDNKGNIGSMLWLAVALGGGGPGSLWGSLIDTAGNTYYVSTVPGQIQAGVFQHVALTYDKASGIARLYVNGQVANQSTLGTFTPQTSYDLYFGLRPSGTAAGNRYAGLMDELTLYERALTPAEVLSIYNAGSAGKCSPAPPAALQVVPPGGLFANSVEVTLTATVAGTTIRYTLDGSDPVATSPAYSTPIVLTGTTTVKARLFFNEYPVSEVVSATFTESLAIMFSPPGGLFTNSVQVTMINNLGLGSILYTSDGSDPVTNSTPYTAPVILTTAATLKARVFLNGFPASEIDVASYARVYALNDGIPSSWREHYFGPGYLTDPRVAANADPDGDGYRNLLEYAYGTDPTDKNSHPSRLGIRAIPLVSWDSVPGWTYRVLRKPSITATNWDVLLPAFTATDTNSQYIDVDAPATSLYEIELLP